MIRHRRIQGPRASWSADDRHWDPWRNNLVTSTGLQGPLLRCVFEIASGGEYIYIFLIGCSLWEEAVWILRFQVLCIRDTLRAQADHPVFVWLFLVKSEHRSMAEEKYR